MSEPTMKEKRELIKNTYLAHTHSDEGGRFAKATPTNVIGSSPVSYPRVPSGPWSDQPMPGPEAPLGFSVEETPVVGEQWEIEKSLDENFAVQRAIRDGAPPSPGGLTPAALEQAPGGEVVRSGQAEEPALREPLTPSGRHSITQRRVSPSNSIKRRLR